MDVFLLVVLYDTKFMFLYLSKRKRDRKKDNESVQIETYLIKPLIFIDKIIKVSKEGKGLKKGTKFN